MNDSKITDIVDLVTEYMRSIGREIAVTDIVSFLFCDEWNTSDHQKWLNESDSQEIADWVIAGLT